MPRKPKSFFYIYKTTCKVTGRYYIGMHATSNLEDGYIGSGRRLKYSIQKHGLENHTKEILEFLPDQTSLVNREIQLVNEDLLMDPNCMNLMKGGEGGFISVEQQKRRAIAAGKATALKLKTDPIFKAAFSKQISENNSIRHALGILHAPDWRGKKHKDETKRKIGSANIENHIGSKNSQYGTMWITTGTKNKRIKKTNTVPNGWKLGRKIKIDL